jgi:hypothetical protein
MATVRSGAGVAAEVAGGGTAAEPRPGSRSALIVASNEYQDPGLSRLRAPAADADALAAALSDPAIGGFEVKTLLNAPAHVVNEAVEEFLSDRSPDDLLLLHFSCHGIKDQEGELYFAMPNTRLRLLGATAVAANFVNRGMTQSRSRRIVLFLDCCYAGAFERGLRARATKTMDLEERFSGRGRAVITASGALEYAFEGGELTESADPAPSVFTTAMVRGLTTGEADRDQDGYIDLDELYDYVYDAVREVTPYQSPGKWTFGVQGDLVIARRSGPVTEPSPLPTEIQESLGSPLAGVRAGAVDELIRLLVGSHQGLALAARQTLERLAAEDDSRTVVAAASAALAASADPDAGTPPEASPTGTGVAPSAPGTPAAGRPAVLDRDRAAEAGATPPDAASSRGRVATPGAGAEAEQRAGPPPTASSTPASSTPASSTPGDSTAGQARADAVEEPHEASGTDGPRRHWWPSTTRMRALVAAVVVVVLAGGVAGWQVLGSGQESEQHSTTIPASFDGQWKGTGGQYDAEFVATLVSGLNLGRLNSGSSSCYGGVLRVTDATDAQLTTRFRPDPPKCNHWTVVFTHLAGGDLKMAVDPDTSLDYEPQFQVRMTRQK